MAFDFQRLQNLMHDNGSNKRRPIIVMGIITYKCKKGGKAKRIVR